MRLPSQHHHAKLTLILRKKSIRQCLLSACSTALRSANVSGAGDARTKIVLGAKTPSGAPAAFRAAICAMAVVAFRCSVGLGSWVGSRFAVVVRILEKAGVSLPGWDWPMEGRGSWTHWYAGIGVLRHRARAPTPLPRTPTAMAADRD